MFAKFLTLIAVLAFAFTALAQHGHTNGGHQSNGHQGSSHSRPESSRGHEREHRPERGRDGRRFDRDTHHHVDYHHTRVGRSGRMEFFWGGFWFGCGEDMPYWIFREDVYIEMIGPDIYVVRVYNNPAMMVEVVVVE